MSREAIYHRAGDWATHIVAPIALSEKDFGAMHTNTIPSHNHVEALSDA